MLDCKLGSICFISIFSYLFLYRSSKYQYFRLSAQKPGVVVVRTSSDSEEIEVQVLRPRAQFPASLPPVLPAGGLSRQRQEYLYKNVRPYVRPSFQDITCPATATDDNQ